MRKLFCLPLGKLNIIIKKSSEFIFRVPLINNQAGRVNFGFASKMIFLLWRVCGGLLLHMLESNYLSILIKPTYGKPLDTMEDILDRGFKVLLRPGHNSTIDQMKNSPSPLTRQLADNVVMAKVGFYVIES